MSFVIAVAGKGGTGKTTTAALIVRYLLKSGAKPILAVDADPNSNFAESIGIDIQDTIGSVLTDFLKNKGNIPQGMPKQAFLDMKLHQILKEETNIDTLVMGCPEGPGCYCAANSMLKSFFEDLSGNYKYVVIDNEAGMEHFSRKTETEIDLLIFCTNYSLKGLKTTKRISELIDEIGLTVKDRYLIVNNTPETLDESFAAEIEKIGIPYLGNIVADKSIEERDLKGLPLTELDDSSPAVSSFDTIIEKLLIKN